MIIYPEKFKANINSTFGKKGVFWLRDLDSTIEKCVYKWELFNCFPVDDLSFNYVCKAESGKYGPVILKLGVMTSELIQEYRTLQLLKGRKICKCYDYDEETNAMLIERINPGENLFSQGIPEKQIHTACEIIRDLPVETGFSNEFPYYKDWIQRAFSKADDDLSAYVEKAQIYSDEIDNLKIPDSLLHGDFHHMNILRNTEGSWTLIDPKGIIGKQPMESGRFILNQLNVIDRDDHRKYVNLMFDSFSEALGTDRDTIFKCAYTEFVLSCCWTLEGDIEIDKKEKVLSELKYTTDLYEQFRMKQGKYHV